MHSFFVILYFIYFLTSKIFKNAINGIKLYNFSLLDDKNCIKNIKYVSF